jgi:acyl-CoA synthetase (AMP-forming)/AMP-acid ligase II
MLLCDVLEMNALKDAGRTALVFEGRDISFGELRDRAFQVANAMSGLASPGDRVAILSDNLAEYVECYYGVPAAGMALTFMNQRLHAEEWTWILNNAEASVLIVQDKYLGDIEGYLEKIPSLKHVLVLGEPSGKQAYADVVGAASADKPRAAVDEETTAWLLYTSGTTGFPKGAMLSHRNLMTSVLSSVIELELQPDERQLIPLPLCHVAGHAVIVAHVRGGSIVLSRRFEPEEWMQLVDQYEVTAVAMVPTMLDMVLNHPNADRYSLASLRTIGYGAAPMPLPVLKATIDRFGPIVYAGFGMTELAGVVLHLPKSAHVRAINGEENLLGSCGAAMCLVDVQVVDEDMNECPPGTVGEIVVRGDQVLKGYFRNEEANATAFVDGWFRTGDLAHADEEGHIFIVDRLKDMIITGGLNVYSREVEEALYRHPSVAEAAVIGTPDPKWGEQVTAVVVLRPDTTATEGELIESVRGRLAGFKAPKRVVFHTELPKTASGKVMKHELRRELNETGSEA